ncbi:MAG: LD-carboxypeptidase [Alphaproteobacteria bacterium]|nr:LD-carboxypeptidase [Alphaproteobacteria bacterium]
MLIGQKLWGFLNPGDTISVVAPSSPPLNPAKVFDFLRSYFAKTPYELFIPEGLIEPTYPLNEANSIEKRAGFIEEALHSDAKAIWALQGGGWAMDILPLVEKMAIPERVIPLIGYGDISALHVYLNSVWHWPTLHAPTLHAFETELPGAASDDDKQSHTGINDVLDVLSGKISHLSYELKPINASAKVEGEVACTYITGGNSFVLSAMNGSGPFQPQVDGGILFIESVAAIPGVFSRLINGIKYGEISQRVKAVLFGDLVNEVGTPNLPLIQTQYDFLIARFSEAFDERGIPVLQAKNLFGHGPINKVLPFNTPATIQLGSFPVLNVSING